MDNNFQQLCVMQGVIVKESEIEDFENFFAKEMGVRIKYHTQVKTNPYKDKNRKNIPETGGRNDVMFYIHKDDVVSFAVKRMGMGIRWWEDVVKYNNGAYLYSKEFLKSHPATW